MVRLCAYKTPATPAIALAIVNAISLYFIALMPTDSAATLLSRSAFIFLPVLELTRFIIIVTTIKSKMTPAVNEE